MIDYNNSDRYEKVDWLRKINTADGKHLAGVLSMLAGQLPSSEFTKIYEYMCDAWDIHRDQTEIDNLKPKAKNESN